MTFSHDFPNDYIKALLVKKFVSLVIIGIFCFFLITCKKSPTSPEPPDPEPEQPVQVTLSFNVYNHTQGFLANFKREVMSGDNVTIKENELNVSGVDKNRIVIRKDGELVVFSRNGEAVLEAPKSNTNYRIYMMNTSNDAPYHKIDEWVDKRGGYVFYKRSATWHREDRDGYTGYPEWPPHEAIRQLHNALQYPWASYGSLTKVNSGGDFGVGYGYCNGHYGIHSNTSHWAGVNPINANTYQRKLKFFVDEIFELLTLAVLIPMNPATDSDSIRPPSGAKRRWSFIIAPSDRNGSRMIFVFS